MEAGSLQVPEHQHINNGKHSIKYENENAVEETLERLGVDYVVLLYIHQPAGNWLAGYRQLEKAYLIDLTVTNPQGRVWRFFVIINLIFD